jgi:hypothetical protein
MSGQQGWIRESHRGAYLGPGPDLRAAAVAANAHFDVFDWQGHRLILGKCSRLPDDEDLEAGCFGIDFHRALPAFAGTTEATCNLGAGPVAVNALNYACYLPQTLRFREFTANLAFAARSWEEYQAKCRVYQEFYHYLYNSDCHTILAAPHSGEICRPPDIYQPFPQSEIDAWTARVLVHCVGPVPAGRRRLLVSLHSTDYFGALLDIGDFGLPQNRFLPQLIARLQERYAGVLDFALPAYWAYILPYTRARLEWLERHWQTLDPERLAGISTAARFEILRLLRVLENYLNPGPGLTLAALVRSLEQYSLRPTRPFLTLNGFFSGRKTARLLNLAPRLEQAGIHTAVQVECSRFLARHNPDLTAALIRALLEGLATLPG